MPTELGPHDLTSNTSHSPFVASASSHAGANDAWGAFAFDVGGTPHYWFANATTGWLQMDLGSASILGSYALSNVSAVGAPSASQMAKTWIMQGSNDGTTWTTVDTRASETGWSPAQSRTYTCATVTTAYRYFRITISANNGDTSNVGISELSLYAVSLTAQTITFAVIPAHLTTDGPITLAATSSSGLTVAYAITGPATLAGSVVTLTGAVGSVVVTASQAGNSTYAAATNVVRSFAVTAAAITERGGITYDQVRGTDRSGTGIKLATVTGTTTTGHLPAFDASGALVDSGSAGVALFSGSLAGDVTGTQAATVVGKVNGVSFASLGTGILKNTTTTGVPGIAVAADFPTLNQSTTGTAANATTAVSFSGSLAGDVTGTQGATVVGKVNGVSFASLGTGLLKNTTTTGVPSIAVSADVIAALGYTPTSPATLAAWPGSANIVTIGTITTGTVPVARITGLAPVATSGSATDLTAGTLPAGRLPNPSATTLGGIQSYLPVANQFIDRISTAGVPLSRAIAAADVQGPGTLNTILGVGSFNITATGTSNTVFGSASLAADTTGSYNVAVGWNALLNNTSGDRNMAVGVAALYSNTSGQSNLGIGTSALQSNTTGSHNVAIGQDAGYSPASSITGSSNTFIGYAACIFGGTDPLNNATAIGANAIVPVSNCVALGDSSVTRIYLGGKVSIYIGAGSPNSAVVGKPGDIYLNTSGGAGTTIYIKESGTNTNTGWIGK
jgi:hypothetical protein